MKYLKLIFFLIIGYLPAQSQTGGYTIIGRDVVFTFDIRDYEKATDLKNGNRVDIRTLNINEADLSGEFNNWSEQGWKMERIDKYTYQLKKPLKDFNDKLSWEFKFIINNEFWVEPDNRFSNITEAKKNGISLHVYNLQMHTALANNTGNAKFKLKGYLNAKKVILTGDFNHWNEDSFRMHKTNDGWELNLRLKAGTYQYKFIIDGKWIEDPTNPNKVYNEFMTHNSVIFITKKIPFSLKGYSEANNVILAGSFNNWNEHSLRMTKTDKGWERTLELPGGKHQYKFIVDGKWITDPDNPLREYDGEGNINSVLLVE